MGHKIPPPYPEVEFGVDCPSCTPSPWYPGRTPIWLYATFQGVHSQQGYPAFPNRHPFTLHQDAAISCLWLGAEYIEGYNWLIRLDMWQGLLNVIIEGPPWEYSFWSLVSPCTFNYPNQRSPDPPHGGWGGTGHIGYSAIPLATLLTSHYHLLPRAGTLFEQSDVGIDHTMIRLANPLAHSCCYVLIDTQAFDFSQD